MMMEMMIETDQSNETNGKIELFCYFILSGSVRNHPPDTNSLDHTPA